MKKDGDRQDSADLREEYEFSRGERGKYASRFAEGSNLVLLDDDIAEVFHDSESVNRALRPLSEIIRKRLAEQDESADHAVLRDRGPSYNPGTE